MCAELDKTFEESVCLFQHVGGSITLLLNAVVLLMIVVDGDARNKDYRKYLCCLQIVSMTGDGLSDVYAPIVLFNRGILYSDSFLSHSLSFWNFFEIEMMLMAEVIVAYFLCVYYRRGMVLSKGRFSYFGWRRTALYVTVEAGIIAAVTMVLYFGHKSVESSEPLLPPELYWVRNRTTHMYLLPDDNNIIANCVLFPVFLTLISAVIAMLIQITSEVKKGMQWSSKATRRYQQLALRSLVLQGTVPTIVYTIPVIGMAFLQFAKTFIDVGEDFDRKACIICPILHIIMTRHAFVNSLTILYCSPSYRQRMMAVVTNSSIITPTRVVEPTRDNQSSTMANHLIRYGDNPDLTKERKTGTFNTEDLAALLYGSKEVVQRRREISNKVDADPDLGDPVPLEFLSREKRIEAQAYKTRKLTARIFDIVDVTNQEEMAHLVSEVFGCDGYPIAIHSWAFVPAIKGQGHAEMVEELLPRAMNLEIIGTYAQTEMGHGTNLRELETTASYDKTTEEFVLHTPTRSSMKWWPGNLGKMANYSTVAAQLIIDGKNYGPHNFVVQLRSEIDHRPLPGITVGDIGSKMGANTIDHGFLALDRVRIPRKRMMMKFAKVAPDGTYTPPIHSKLSYSSMVFYRSYMIKLQAGNLAAAVTIATRYSAVRRQGRIEKDSKQEVQVLDYQTQQHRIFPQIARAYAHHFVGQEVLGLYEQMTAGLDKGETDLLPDLHALTSGLKSVTSFSNTLAAEQCRMACGGHGYSAASGLPVLTCILAAGCTYEGENMVMLQQAARYLVKCVMRASRGQSLSYSVQYLGRKTEGRSRIGTEKAWTEKEIESLFLSLEHIARRLAVHASKELEKKIKLGETKERAWNGVTVEMNRAARVYTRLFIARCFHRRVLSAPASLRPVLYDLLSLYLHYECVDMAHHLLHDGHCTGEQIDHLKRRLYEDLAKIRPNAVSLVDSFDQSDRQLNSMLGKRDGHAYEALFQWAKASELNYTDVIPAFGHMKAMMEENRAKM